jgi:tellurite resistance protein
MEAILGIIGFIIVWRLGLWLLSAGARTVGAVGKAAMGKGTVSENMDLAFKGMGEIQFRLKNRHLGENGEGPLAKDVQVKGLIPIHETINLGFIISVFDETDGDFEPVLSAIDTFQEKDSVVYQHISEVGEISPNQGFIEWVSVGVVIPVIIEPPYKGNRELVVLARMVDLDDIPTIHHGFTDKGDNKTLFNKRLTFSHTFKDKGYLEASENKEEAAGICLKIGMVVAMADGTLDDSEGNTLKQWVIKEIEHHGKEKQKVLKKLYNDAMREAYIEAREGELTLSDLTYRLNEIGDKTTKYEAIELCMEVMAADGVADASELNIIKKIAQSLGLDMDEVEKLRDQKIIGLNADVTDHASIEEILDIDPNLSIDQIKKRLRTEFQKWNNRLNTLPEGEERQNAQLMLDRIADARKKYG